MNKQALRNWFTQLAPREQILLKIGSVILIIGGFYWLIWAPMNESIERETKLLAQQQALSTWVVQQQAKVLQFRRQGPGKATLKGSLVQAVNQTARASNINLTRMQPSNDEVQVWIDEVGFNTLMTWLSNLDTTGVQVLQVDISESGTPGNVKVRRLLLGKS
ncbi:MAG: Type II secretion system protein M [Glaciecola sp. HTCC2999]|nr:MAG: Type II secretion system protein M [Glaciecola sp. HTCC2999]